MAEDGSVECISLFICHLMGATYLPSPFKHNSLWWRCDLKLQCWKG